MSGKLSCSQSKTSGEKVANNLIVKPIIGTKYQLGLGEKKTTTKKLERKVS